MALVQTSSKCLRSQMRMCPRASQHSSSFITVTRPHRSRRVADVVANAASHATSPTPSTHKTSFSHGITYTSYEINTFTIKFNATGVRVLVDPWLVGDLTFAEQDWLYRGKKRVIGRTLRVDVSQVASETDVLVLTQSLDDHAHLPTLRVFPKSVPVVANPSAAAIARSLGFTDVRVVDHGQSITVCEGRLKITATVGALVGPPWSKRQNGLVFQEVVPPATSPTGEVFRGSSVYFEPHCDFDAQSVGRVGKVDVVISPIVTALLGVGAAAYPLTQGDMNLLQLLKLLQPQVLVPLLNSEMEHEGPLRVLIQERGDYEGVRQQLVKAGLGSVRLEFPAPPGESMAIAL